MHVNIDHQLKNIQLKLQQLLKQYRLLEKENMQLKKALEKIEQNTTAVHTPPSVLTADGTAVLNNTTDKEALQKKIDKYLQEIDKCLLLLNASA